MPTYVIDIETDGLISSKIHVMSVGFKNQEGEWKIKSTADYDTMINIVTNEKNTIIGHNFKAFDTVEIERVLGIKVTAEIIDTLAIAWAILPNRKRPFGLAAFGEEYGVPKPVIDDWEGLTYDQYKHRCEEDVKINIKVWEYLSSKLLEVYDNDIKMSKKYIRYLMFKMECVAEQRKLGVLVDLEMVNANIGLLNQLREPKEANLIAAMPKGAVIKTKPKTMAKKDGSVSKRGETWYEYLRENNLPITTEEVRGEANINSTSQVKEWLFGIGWEPRIFKEGANGDVPQIRTDKKELCPSILELVNIEPAIAELDGLTVINHRLGVLKSFVDTVDKDNYTIASMNGFTNTLRLKHSRPIANLPGVTLAIKKAMDKGLSKLEALSENLRDGQIVRECIIAPEGYELCGTDISSLEDNTKRHYMWDYDPEYVTDQMVDGFDPHLDLALRAGAVMEEEVLSHKLYSSTKGKEGVSLKEQRHNYKQANYSCIYGVGATTLSESTGLPIREAKSLIKTYWERNWSIKQLAKDTTTKTVDGQMWLLNPVNKFWYSLRNERDIFSTLNQGTGSYVFDCWLKFMMMEGVIPFLQYHDEEVSLVRKKKGAREAVSKIINESMEKVNDTLQLNVQIEVDIQFGDTYADVH
tara:strand:+ start:323 stop:2239 length:1917 start_codon:yes stop_codon:yes gene_type:complete